MNDEWIEAKVKSKHGNYYARVLLSECDSREEAYKVAKKRAQYLYHRDHGPSFRMTTVVEPGEVYGQLEIVARHDSRTDGTATWLCRCTCGNIHVASSRDLTRKTRPTVCCKKCKGKKHEKSALQKMRESNNSLGLV